TVDGVVYTVTITAGDTTGSVTVPTTEDTISGEADEVFTAAGAVTSGTTTGAVTNGSVTVQDNDSAPTVTIGDVTVSEGDNAIVPVTLSNPSTEDITVEVTVDGVVYTVTITAGDTTGSVTVPTTEDTISGEADEVFAATGVVTSGTTGAVTNGSVTVQDDDSAPTVTIGDVTVSEGDNAIVPVTLSNPSTEDITVEVTVDGVVYTVTITAGDTTGSVTVPTTEDTISGEADEVFAATGVVTSGTTGAVTNGSVTVQDDDSAPTVTIGDVTVSEG
ncbi:hypothetical protein, partial [Tenacibaculum sp. IB213877]|uniref:hypothetical protein n=1 Tax=Tenacibaculum sp. IB213877 TaxID=3097351 RepID=UPI002A59A5C5